MACTSGEPKVSITDVVGGGATTILALHPDIIQTHILTRLHGPALASAAATSSQLHALSSHNHLWANISHSTWPSTNAPRIRHIISTFPHGPRSFFSDSFPTSFPSSTAHNSRLNRYPTSELISAIDLFHRQRLILSKVVETETETDWFRCSPFRVDLLNPKEVVQTPIKYPSGDGACRDLGEELRLSWILIDPHRRRAMNVSSQKPVSVQRHWLSGEVQVRFPSVFVGERGSATEMVLCSLVVTCGGVEGGEMQVREACMQMEDMEGMHMSGRESLVILQRALEGKRGRAKNGVEEEGMERYREFVERKKERKEEKVRAEGRWDTLCVGLAALSFVGLFCLFVMWRRN